MRVFLAVLALALLALSVVGTQPLPEKETIQLVHALVGKDLLPPLQEKLLHGTPASNAEVQRVLGVAMKSKDWEAARKELLHLAAEANRAATGRAPSGGGIPGGGLVLMSTGLEEGETRDLVRALLGKNVFVKPGKVAEVSALLAAAKQNGDWEKARKSLLAQAPELLGQVFLQVHSRKTERLRKRKADPTPEQVAATMDRLGPVLEKLKGLDPKSFGALSGMMNQVQGSAKPSSFLQFVKDDPNAVQDKMAALEPILDKLRNLDPKAFGALNGLVNQAQTPQAPQKPSLIQRTDPAKAEDQQVDVSGTIDKLQPVLDKLRNLDPKAFGAMSNMIDQASKDGNQK